MLPKFVTHTFPEVSMAMLLGPVPTVKVPSTVPLEFNFATVLPGDESVPEFAIQTLPDGSIAMPYGPGPMPAVNVPSTVPPGFNFVTVLPL